MSDRSPYLVQALQAMQAPGQNTAASTGLDLGAQMLGQMGRQHRQNAMSQQLGSMQGGGTTFDPSMAPELAGSMPMGSLMIGGPNQNGWGQPQTMQQGQNQFGGLFGLGQRLRGLFGGG